ncbi:MAG: D-TA family PLP-dependent enzyme [Chitinophagaceae bacterium]|nr:MAG: D-TA family PLP-dependent enzyme [Chitinophagaceae bacterium]
MKSDEKWYQCRQVSQIDSPALLVYTERVKHNIDLIKTMVDDVAKLRPHVKTAKAKDAVLLMMAAGIQKFKCATIAEAEMLALCKVTDVLLAYQPTEVKLHRLLNLMEAYPSTRFSCLVDNLQSAKLFAKAAAAHNILLPVFIDLNVGMNRTGIIADNKVIDLVEDIVAMPALKLLGFHAYDGHLTEVDLKKRSKICNALFEPVERLRTSLTEKGYLLPLLIAGGSPSFQIHSQRLNAEVSPGTFVFWDKGYLENLPEQAFLPAAVVMTRVISLPAEDKICIDLGHKSIASENDLLHRVFFLNAPHLKPCSHSEEHMVLTADLQHGFGIGDVLYAVPYHICPTVALYKKAYCIHSNETIGEWQILARDRKINF